MQSGVGRRAGSDHGNPLKQIELVVHRRAESSLEARFRRRKRASKTMCVGLRPDPVTRVFRYPNAASKRQNRLKLPIILIQINQLAWSDPFDQHRRPPYRGRHRSVCARRTHRGTWPPGAGRRTSQCSGRRAVADDHPPSPGLPSHQPHGLTSTPDRVDVGSFLNAGRNAGRICIVDGFCLGYEIL